MKKLQKRIDKIENILLEEVGASTMDLIHELIELNIEIEQECNK